MKKFILSVAFLAGSAISFSQTNNDRPAEGNVDESIFAIGTKGGYGHSFLFPYSNCGFKSSWNIGLAVLYAPWEHFGFGLDGMYSSEGVTFKSGDYSSTTQLDYFRIPLKFMVFCRKYENDFRPKFGIGPTVGFLMNDPGAGYANTDFGFNAVWGFNYRLLRGFWLTMDVDYYNGLTDIYDYNSEKDWNGNLRLNVGLMVGF